LPISTLKNYQAAFDDYSRVLVFDPEYAAAWLNRGVTMQYLDNLPPPATIGIPPHPWALPRPNPISINIVPPDPVTFSLLTD
jgi:hypothetical protein